MSQPWPLRAPRQSWSMARLPVLLCGVEAEHLREIFDVHLRAWSGMSFKTFNRNIYLRTAG
ncbi:MAG: hypothetical protein GEV06_13095 [Luteitalea sp.]|nr:hypothetical protein [Luteitalea sp.]